MSTRGIRGAIDVAEDSPEAILCAAKKLLRKIIQMNEGLDPEDMASVMFTMTPDLTATFPALAARQLGWVDVPLLCYLEISVPGSLPYILRVLILWNTHRSQKEIRHVYLGEAASLRPDLNTDALQRIS